MSLSVADANALVDQHLGADPRAGHSRRVAALLRLLAQHFHEDEDYWQVVGLCHDLDFIVVARDWARHGLVTAEWLRDSLPEGGLAAIAAHDHRTGVTSDTLLAQMLKLADATTVLGEKLGLAEALAELRSETPYDRLRARLGHRVYLADMIETFAGRHSLSATAMADFLASASGELGRLP